MTDKELVSKMDWSAFDSEGITQTCYCRCGTEYRSHAKINMEVRKSVSYDPCPSCSSHSNLWRTSSDPEIFTLKS
jgi:hypothetical protein